MIADTSERLQRVEFFADLDPQCMASIASELERIHVPVGTALVRQGDLGDALFVVLHGRFSAEFEKPDGTSRQVGEIGPGEIFGEMAMLSAEHRATTVRALRESEVIRLTRAAFERIADRHPILLRRLASLLATRLRAANSTRPRQLAYRTVVLVAHDDAVALSAFAENLHAALERYHAPLLITQQTIPDGDAAEGRERVLAWLAAQESDDRISLLVTQAGYASWNSLALSQADLILVVANADSSPRAGAVESEIHSALLANRQLVLLHPPGATPSGTAAWLSRGRFHRHHHVRQGEDAHMQRLARWLCGRSVGVAFGGGGARGFAHIGVVRAMAEAGVAIDRVGGTSMGSVMAAEVALGWDWQTMLERTKRAFALDPLKRDSTLPLVSLVSGRRVVRMFEGLFGDARAEDCWLPFLSVSCNMTRAEPAIHRDGLLWQRVRSSSALPGIGPPVVENGEFFIDGAILNNLPADLLMDESAGPVVAVNVSPREDLRTRRPDSYHLSGWRLLWDRLLRKHAMQHPSIVWVLQRTVLLNSVASAERLERMVSLYLHPPLDKYEMFGWNLIEEIVRLGYENARKPVLEWALKQSEDLKRSNDTRAG